MISVHPAVLAALESDNFKYAHLVALPGGLFFTDHGSDILYSGDTYVSNGSLLKTSPVMREKGLKAHTHQITLSSVLTAIYTLYKATSMVGVVGKTYKAVLDAAGAIIANAPILIYQGTLDSWTMAENNSTSKMSIKLTNKWSAMLQTSGRLTNPDSQKTVDTTDKFFEMAHEEKSNIGWGSK